ncbi:hypothetical protein RF11_15573 [Thelohanellus kitauei]|uniref:Uncharacterized protein n=1 Tax=Thelohanellus kitauei TaxID=669202 RepID=A0A0C2NDR1_THEKT|nr:hypothetical protein RF11_15573 [Thelohanellus kitauei]
MSNLGCNLIFQLGFSTIKRTKTNSTVKYSQDSIRNIIDQKDEDSGSNLTRFESDIFMTKLNASQNLSTIIIDILNHYLPQTHDLDWDQDKLSIEYLYWKKWKLNELIINNNFRDSLIVQYNFLAHMNDFFQHYSLK